MNIQDRITIKDWAVQCHIGLPHNDANLEDVLLSIDVYLPLQTAALNNDIKDSCDYQMLMNTVLDFLENAQSQLTEGMVLSIIQCIFHNFEADEVAVSLKRDFGTEGKHVEFFMQRSKENLAS